MELLNRLMRITPDPLKWLDDMLAVMRYGPGVKLTWAKCSAWNGARGEMLLRRYGIKCYRRQYAYTEGDDYGVHVPAAQGRWAEHVMRKAGVPLTSPLIDESNRRVQPGPMPQEWGVPAKPTGIAGALVQMLSPQSATPRRRRPRRR